MSVEDAERAAISRAIWWELRGRRIEPEEGKLLLRLGYLEQLDDLNHPWLTRLGMRHMARAAVKWYHEIAQEHELLKE